MKSRETDRKMWTGFVWNGTEAKIKNGRSSQKKGPFLIGQRLRTAL